MTMIVNTHNVYYSNNSNYNDKHNPCTKILSKPFQRYFLSNKNNFFMTARTGGIYWSVFGCYNDNRSTNFHIGEIFIVSSLKNQPWLFGSSWLFFFWWFFGYNSSLFSWLLVWVSKGLKKPPPRLYSGDSEIPPCLWFMGIQLNLHERRISMLHITSLRFSESSTLQ